MIDTEQRWRMRWPGPEPVVRNVVSWRTIPLRQAVASKLRLNWSPEQIAGWLKRCASWR